MSASLPGADQVSVSLAVAGATEAHEIREGVGLAVALDAEVAERHDVVHVERLPKFGRRDPAVRAAAVAITGFPSSAAPRRPVGQLALGVAVPPVPVLLPTRGAAIAERLTVARFRAEAPIRTTTERERLAACIADTFTPGAIAPSGVVAGLGAEGATSVRQIGGLDLEAPGTLTARHRGPISAGGSAASARAKEPLASADLSGRRREGGAAVAAGTLYGHRSSLLRCHGPGCFQHRRAFVRPDFTTQRGGD